MPLKTIVKVSHISNLSDARYCAGMGVEMLGFQVISDAEGYISPEIYRDIRGWISGPAIIAELYGVSDPVQLATAIEIYAPDYFELTLESYRRFGKLLQLPCIVYVTDVAEIEALEPDSNIKYLLIDEHVTAADVRTTEYPILKKIASLGALQEGMDENCFSGYVLEGPKELRPGVTNYEQLGSILEALEED